MYAYYSFVEEVPFTGRRRLIATSREWERKMGDRECATLRKRFGSRVLPPDHRASVTVRRVGSRLARAAEEFAERHGSSSSSSSGTADRPRPYAYTVVRSEQANAFVLPNNHVFVLTGLFRYARDEDELAAVLGHEMAHNLARHAGEKVSGSALASLAARVALATDPTGGLLTGLFLSGATLLHELPHSRQAEVEADQIGLHLAASACYDPTAAKRVFAAMRSDGDEKTAPPEFASTHPSYDTRLDNLEEWMPEALEKYNDRRRGCGRVREEMGNARREALNAAKRKEAASERMVKDRGF